MKILLIFNICIFLYVIPTKGYSQNAIVVKYDFYHVRDSLQPQKIYYEEMMLVANATNSLYKSYALFAFDSVMKRKQLNKNETNVVNIPRGTTEQIFTNFSNNEIIYIKPWLGDTFGIRLPLKEIEWQLIDSSKKIGNLICYKAIGMFKGRKYTCWYCPEIPVKSGPWKLMGLPGLIVNATDEKGHVSFRLTSLWQNNTEKIYIPNITSYITETKFEEMKEALLANPGAALGNDVGGGKLNFQKSGNSKAKTKVNNPLELSEF